MNRLSYSLTVLLTPVLLLGTSACSSMGQTKARLAEWKEKREERRMAQEVAMAEKEVAEEAERTGQVASTGMEDSIFLDYANPSGSLTGESAPYGAGPALPGSELPVVGDMASTYGEGGPGGVPIFHGDDAGLPPVSEDATPRVDADLVRAWAASISPLMGASLTEPLITAAMTAQVTPTETAVAAHAAATDSAPLASAFAGQPARSSVRLLSTSELEHE